MFAEIITIGDELLIGQVVDTNSAWMGQELNKIGIEVLLCYCLHNYSPNPFSTLNAKHMLQFVQHIIYSAFNSFWLIP